MFENREALEKKNLIRLNSKFNTDGTLTAEQFVDEIVDFFLGEDYTIVDPLSESQARFLEILDIENKYLKKLKNILKKEKN